LHKQFGKRLRYLFFYSNSKLFIMDSQEQSRTVAQAFVFSMAVVFIAFVIGSIYFYVNEKELKEKREKHSNVSHI